MTNQQSDAVREQLREAVVNAMSSGAFHDAEDLREAIILAQHALERGAKASQSNHVLRP